MFKRQKESHHLHLGINIILNLISVEAELLLILWEARPVKKLWDAYLAITLNFNKIFIFRILYDILAKSMKTRNFSTKSRKMAKKQVANKARAQPSNNRFGIAGKNWSKTHSQTVGPRASLEGHFWPFKPFGTKIPENDHLSWQMP